MVGSERHDYFTVDVCYRFQRTSLSELSNNYVNSVGLYLS